MLKSDIAKKPREPARKTFVRAGHEWTCGVPGSYTDEDLARTAGRYIACPGCTLDDFSLGKCHTVAIIDEFKRKFPELEPPTWRSLATVTVEGPGGLRDVLIAKDAIFMGCKPKRAAPHGRELGVKLPRSIFGNPEVLARIQGKTAGAARAEECV